MAMDALTNQVYHSTATTGAITNQKMHNTNSQAAAVMNIKVSEIPENKSSSPNILKKEQNDLQVTDQYIKSEISKANSKIRRHNTRCEFSYHEETKRVSIKVLDRDTEEVIREIPPEKTLEMIQRMWELAGFLVDERG